jgi:NAD(P)-dependent dehydrogenase (short-subunit alcohol dehydrogenase family)
MLLVRMIDMQREKIARPSPENAGWSTPEEISAAVAYLLSDEAGTVNGASIPLFGRAP